VNFWFNRK